MSDTVLTLSITAITLGVIHTLIGPDHYLPFIVISRARGWSIARTAWITVLCGIGHVAGSIVLGIIGIVAGRALFELKAIQEHRGNIAAYLFIAFGLVYFVWGLRRAIRNRPHTHKHVHLDEGDADDQRHKHDDEPSKPSITPWVLFTVFVFGPCEALVPLLMFPAAIESWWVVGLVTGLFAASTIGTMLAAVAVGSLGFRFIPMKKLERYTHALAGATISLCGVLILIGL
jgi:sulfite exporter TauE/SafE